MAMSRSWRSSACAPMPEPRVWQFAHENCDYRWRNATPREATRRDSCAGVFEPPSHFLSRGESWMLRDDGALPEDHEVRNGSYSESGAQGRLCFRIDLQD
jgi:hypothetical protein